MASKSNARKSLTAKQRGIVFRHSVTIEHGNGSMVTTVRARDGLAVWTNKKQNGPTVRVDHTGPGIRFFNGQVVKSDLNL